MPSKERECVVSPTDLPASMAPLVQRCVWARESAGTSGDAVYRVQPSGRGATLYPKHARGAGALALTAENVRLRWLADRVPVPAVRQFVASAERHGC